MTPSVAMLEAMQAEGLDLAACIRVLKAGEVRRDPTAAERQARHREKVKAERDEVTRDVTRDEVTAPPFLDKKPPHTPQKINPIPCVRDAHEGRFHRLPDGWSPTKPLPAPLQSKVDLWPPGALADETAALKRWAANAENKNGKGKKLDWDKALWNWLGRRHDERYARTSQISRSRNLSASVSAFGDPSTWAGQSF